MWEHLHAIAETWDDLVDRLAGASDSALSERVQSSRDPGLVLNEAVAATMHEVAGWLAFVARLVIDERKLTEPKDTTSAGLARWLASKHVDWLATHHDEQLVASIATEAAEHANAIRRSAYPSGARLLDMPWMACTDHVLTDVEGARTPCPGHMTAWVMPQAAVLPDLVCNVEPEHRVDPATWQRQGWKRQSIDPAAAERLAHAVFGESLA